MSGSRERPAQECEETEYARYQEADNGRYQEAENARRRSVEKTEYARYQEAEYTRLRSSEYARSVGLVEPTDDPIWRGSAFIPARPEPRGSPLLGFHPRMTSRDPACE